MFKGETVNAEMRCLEVVVGWEGEEKGAHFFKVFGGAYFEMQRLFGQQSARKGDL